MIEGWYKLTCSKCGKEDNMPFNSSPYLCGACELIKEHGSSLINQVVDMVKKQGRKGIMTEEIAKKIDRNYCDTQELLELIRLYSYDLGIEQIDELFDDEVTMQYRWYTKNVFNT